MTAPTAQKWAEEKAREIVEDQVSMTGYVGSNDWLRTKIAAALVEAEARVSNRYAEADKESERLCNERHEADRLKIEQARTEGEQIGREVGLEEAAKSAETHQDLHTSNLGYSNCALKIAETIRALRGKP